MNEIFDIIHKTIYQFFDVCGDDEEVPLSDKDKLLLEVNKAICNNLKSLEQAPCGDTISRQAVLKLQYRIDDSATLSIRDVVNVEDIEDLPSITPKEKTGHWIAHSDGIWIKYYECSECGKVHDTYSDYCPNCGEKMEGVKDERFGRVLSTLEQDPTYCDCSTCVNSDEVDGSNCYECVKDMKNNYKND